MFNAYAVFIYILLYYLSLTMFFLKAIIVKIIPDIINTVIGIIPKLATLSNVYVIPKALFALVIILPKYTDG